MGGAIAPPPPLATLLCACKNNKTKRVMLGVCVVCLKGVSQIIKCEVDPYIAQLLNIASMLELHITLCPSERQLKLCFNQVRIVYSSRLTKISPQSVML